MYIKIADCIYILCTVIVMQTGVNILYMYIMLNHSLSRAIAMVQNTTDCLTCRLHTNESLLHLSVIYTACLFGLLYVTLVYLAACLQIISIRLLISLKLISLHWNVL